jgi:hypothetical protein
MRKFIYLSLKGTSAIYECEVSIVTPKPIECKNDEELYIVEQPPEFAGERWYSQFFQDTLEQCLEKAKQTILFKAQRLSTKKGITFSEDDIKSKIDAIVIKTSISNYPSVFD